MRIETMLHASMEQMKGDGAMAQVRLDKDYWKDCKYRMDRKTYVMLMPLRGLTQTQI